MTSAFFKLDYRPIKKFCSQYFKKEQNSIKSSSLNRQEISHPNGCSLQPTGVKIELLELGTSSCWSARHRNCTIPSLIEVKASKEILAENIII